jgi:hypothetical protein
MISQDAKNMYYLGAKSNGPQVQMSEVSLLDSEFGKVTRQITLDPYGPNFCGILTPDNNTAFALGGTANDVVLIQIDLVSYTVQSSWIMNLPESYINCQFAVSPLTRLVYLFSTEGFAEFDTTTSTLRIVNFPQNISSVDHFVLDRKNPILYWSSDPSGGYDLSREVAFDLDAWEVMLYRDYASPNLYPQTNMYFGTYLGEYVMVYMSVYNNSIPAVNALEFKTLLVLASVQLPELIGYWPSNVAGYGMGGDSWLAFVNATNTNIGLIVEWPVASWNFTESQQIGVVGNPLPFSLQEPKTEIDHLFFTGPSNNSKQPTLYLIGQSQED